MAYFLMKANSDKEGQKERNDILGKISIHDRWTNFKIRTIILFIVIFLIAIYYIIFYFFI